MDSIEWSERCSVGVPAVDAQHRHLAKLINRVVANQRDGVRSSSVAEALDAVMAYAATHFAAEERLLAEAGYPDLASHCTSHSAFTEQAAELCLAAVDGTRSVPGDLAAFLVSWWYDHVLTDDMAYRPFLADRAVSADL